MGFIDNVKRTYGEAWVSSRLLSPFLTPTHSVNFNTTCI